MGGWERKHEEFAEKDKTKEKRWQRRGQLKGKLAVLNDMEDRHDLLTPLLTAIIMLK